MFAFSACLIHRCPLSSAAHVSISQLQQRVRILELARRVDHLERRMLAQGYELKSSE